MKAADSWQARFAPWLARATAAASGNVPEVALVASPSPKPFSPRTTRAAAAGDGDSNGSGSEDGGIDWSLQGGQAASFAGVLISPAAGGDPEVQAAFKRGYWRHAPAVRLAGLLDLCRDALDCWQLR